MKRQYGDKVGFEFTIHSYHRREIKPFRTHYKTADWNS